MAGRRGTLNNDGGCGWDERILSGDDVFGTLGPRRRKGCRWDSSKLTRAGKDVEEFYPLNTAFNYNVNRLPSDSNIKWGLSRCSCPRHPGDGNRSPGRLKQLSLR